MNKKYEFLDHTADLTYKDVSNVVNVMDNEGITSKVARLRPLGVIKG